MKITRKVINFNKVNQTGGAFKLNEHGKERLKKYNDPEYKEKKVKIYKPEFYHGGIGYSFVTANGVRGEVRDIMWDDTYKAFDLFYYRVHLDNDSRPKILSERQMFHEYELDKIQTGGASTNLYTGLKNMPVEERLGVYEHSLNKLFDITGQLAQTMKDRTDQLTKVETRVNLNMDDINKIKSKLGI